MCCRASFDPVLIYVQSSVDLVSSLVSDHKQNNQVDLRDLDLDYVFYELINYSQASCE